jgi:hypothetical protein
VSLHRATALRRGSWDYEFLPSRGIRRQYLSLMRKLKGIHRNYTRRLETDYSRAIARLHANKENKIKNFPIFYYLIRI